MSVARRPGAWRAQAKATALPWHAGLTSEQES